MSGISTSRPVRASPQLGANEKMVSVVLPTYREAENLPLLVPKLSVVLRTWPHEIIIVDANSDDGTEDIVKELRADGHAVRLIVRSDQRGLV